MDEALPLNSDIDNALFIQHNSTSGNVGTEAIAN
jgi:hypothetical protein